MFGLSRKRICNTTQREFLPQLRCNNGREWEAQINNKGETTLNDQKEKTQWEILCEAYKQEKAERYKRYYEKNREEILARKKIYAKKYYQTHRQEILEKQAKYNEAHRREHKAERQAYAKKYREEHREELLLKAKKYREENREKILLRDRKYREENREKIRERAREYARKKRGKSEPKVCVGDCSKCTLEYCIMLGKK